MVRCSSIQALVSSLAHLSNSSGSFMLYLPPSRSVLVGAFAGVDRGDHRSGLLQGHPLTAESPQIGAHYHAALVLAAPCMCLRFAVRAQELEILGAVAS